MNNKIRYDLILDGDNTLKTFFERFYVVPKDIPLTDEEKKFLESRGVYLIGDNTKVGKDGYIVFRKNKKLNQEQVQQIKNDVGSYRSLAKKYNVSVGTISKIKNGKY